MRSGWGGDRLLVLNRRLTVFGWFTARLALVRLPGPAEGAVLRGATVATFDRPGPVDNMEALALTREGGRAGPVDRLGRQSPVPAEDPAVQVRPAAPTGSATRRRPDPT